MAYADQQMSGNRIVAIAIVVLIHIAIGYVLITGLAYEAVKKAVERVTTVDIDEPPPPPPPEEPPPPEPQEQQPQETSPPIVVPPPPVSLSTFTPQKTTQDIPPPRPVSTAPSLPKPPGPPAPPAPPAPPSQARGIRPKNQNSWAARIQEDYPQSAISRNQEGTVTMRITVDADGRVSECSVSGSSGSSALDSAACRGMQRYARYQAALNDAGDPISASTTQSIRYVLPR